MPHAPTSPPPAAPPVSVASRRSAARTAARATHHDGPLAVPTLGPPPAALAGSRRTPLYDAVLAVVLDVLQSAGHSRPTCKRLALLVAGLLGSEHGTPTAVAQAAWRQGIGTATQEPSVARRVDRLLDAPQLDAARLLPVLAQRLLPVLLADAARAHDHSVGTRGPSPHHARWRGVRLVLDETSHTDQTHVLVVGLAYRGVVLPLGVRTWPQNTPLPPHTYWPTVLALLTEIQDALPPPLRAHVVLLADRAYAVPALFALLTAFGWAAVLRAQGQVRVRLPDGTERALHTLVPRPGCVWTSAPGATWAPAAAGLAETADVVGVFKGAGWLALRVVAVWLPEQAAPWLLLTTLPVRRQRLLEYAARWAIERLFLSWKSHGWQLEATHCTPARLARLLTGYVVATWYLLAAAIRPATQQLGRLAAHSTHAPSHPVQLPLPWEPPHRPWPAKRSLLTLGRHAFRACDLRFRTPPLCWPLPAWEAPAWSVECTRLYHGLPSPDGQFSASP
jgi:hypothetical protein